MAKAKLLVFLFSTFVGLAFAEVGLWSVGPFQRAGKSPDHILWQPDAEIGFAPAANLNAVAYSNEWSNRVRTNEFGFRINSTFLPSTNSRSDKNTIMFLGDSQTMGAQVPAQATYVALIEREFANKGRAVNAINAGCNAFNTVQQYLFFRKLYDRGMRPRIVMVFVTNNDLFEDVSGLPYGRYYVDSNGYVVPTQPDPRLMDQLKRAKETKPAGPNFWLEHSALLRHIWYAYRTIRTPHDVAAWVKNVYLRDDLDPEAGKRWAVATAAIRSLHRLVSSYGGVLVIAVNPDPVEWSDEYYAKLAALVPELENRIDRMKLQRGYRRIAEGVGAGFIDMLDQFPKVPVREFRFAMDPHANVSGHRLIAAQMLKGFERLGLPG